MGKIVVIGGGEIGTYETLTIDKRISELTGKKNPKALFIPTASGEPEGYVNSFNKVYGDKLRCITDTLYLLKTKPTVKQLSEKILSADLIYVGGGNTLAMMKRWRLLGVDKILRTAYDKGIILSGLSAGGICWFESGHSDSISFYHPDNWDYINVRGLGLIKGIHCPHFNGETRGIKRKKSFSDFMKKYSAMGIAIDNHCAIEFVNDKFRVISLKKNRHAYRIFRRKNELIREEIPETTYYLDITNLYDKAKTLIAR